MQFKNLFVTFIVLGLFVFSMLSFITVFQDENNVSNKLTDNPTMNAAYGNLSNNLVTYSGNAQSQKTLFESENPTAGFDSILLFSIISSGKVFNGMVIGVYNTLIKLPAAVLGISPIVIAALSTILIVAIILGLWSVYKAGS